MKKITSKEYTIEKGDEDWKVWSKANDYLFEIMHKKRKAKYRIRKLRKPITVRITFKEA